MEENIVKIEKELKDLDYNEMGRRIRSQREFLNMTREELAGLIGVSSKFIADVEYGEKGVSIRKLYLLSQVLDISADYILAGKKNDSSEAEEKRRLKENILEPLNKCNADQLKCMEQIAKFYVEGLSKK